MDIDFAKDSGAWNLIKELFRYDRFGKEPTDEEVQRVILEIREQGFSDSIGWSVPRQTIESLKHTLQWRQEEEEEKARLKRYIESLVPEEPWQRRARLRRDPWSRGGNLE